MVKMGLNTLIEVSEALASLIEKGHPLNSKLFIRAGDKVGIIKSIAAGNSEGGESLVQIEMQVE